MIEFFNLKSNSVTDHEATGAAIMKVSRSVFKNTPTSEWKKFNEDIRGWLWTNGYRYDGDKAGPRGEIPAHVQLVPVYDSENIMHVRIPWAGVFDLDRTITDESGYGSGKKTREKVLLARYFMRHCR